MILIIDNYDSFVYNLARYVELCGHKTHVVRNDQIDLAAVNKLNPSKIILSPGPGTPDDAGISLALIKQLYIIVPILGVCLGHQAIAAAFGAKITRARYPMHGMSSWIEHNNDSILANLPNPLQVGRYHSLIVDGLPTNSNLLVMARSEEGEIMALRHKEYPTFGVQFHPESILTIEGLTIIRNFLKI